MTSASGWCSAPPGVRPQHHGCRSAVCGCECHESPAQTGVSVDLSLRTRLGQTALLDGETA